MKTTLLICLAWCALLGCKQEDGLLDSAPDTRRPEITLLSPDQRSVLRPGHAFSLRLRLTDDRKLSECRWRIACTDDVTGQDANSLPYYRREEVVALSGADFLITRAIHIPDSISPGPYHLHVQCLDKANHLSELRIYADYD